MGPAHSCWIYQGLEALTDLCFDTLFRTVFAQISSRDEVTSSIKSTLVSKCYKGGESSKLSAPFLYHHLPRLQTFI